MNDGTTKNATDLRTRFRDFYKSSKEVRDQLMKSGTFVLDTNILLNFYRISKTSRLSLLSDLSDRSSQLWMPFQTAAELHDNCDKVRSEQTAKHKERIKLVKDFANQMSTTEKRSRLEVTDEQNHALEAVEAWRVKLETELEEIQNEIHHQRTDEILERIADIYGNNIGNEPDDEERETLSKEASSRFERKIPPGYMDSSKPDDEGYGDFYFWKQVLNYASETNRDIVLVTDDKKQDWSMKPNGAALRPRPELIEEFKLVTGQQIVILDSNDFFYHLTKDQESPANQEARNDFNEAVKSFEWQSIDELPSDVIERGRMMVHSKSLKSERDISAKDILNEWLRDVPPYPATQDSETDRIVEFARTIVDHRSGKKLIDEEIADKDDLIRNLNKAIERRERTYARHRALGKTEIAETLLHDLNSIQRDLDEAHEGRNRLMNFRDHMNAEQVDRRDDFLRDPWDHPAD